MVNPRPEKYRTVAIPIVISIVVGCLARTVLAVGGLRTRRSRVHDHRRQRFAALDLFPGRPLRRVAVRRQPNSCCAVKASSRRGSADTVFAALIALGNDPCLLLPRSKFAAGRPR